MPLKQGVNIDGLAWTVIRCYLLVTIVVSCNPLFSLSVKMVESG